MHHDYFLRGHRMSQEQAITIGLTAAIAVFGYLMRNSIESVNKRLDGLEEKLGAIVTQLVAASTKQDINAVEIDKLRVKVHEIEAEVIGLGAVQERCRSCNSRN